MGKGGDVGRKSVGEKREAEEAVSGRERGESSLQPHSSRARVFLRADLPDKALLGTLALQRLPSPDTVHAHGR